jgi:cytochrome b
MKETSMNTVSESRADRAEEHEPTARILVWDAPVRVFHWLLVLSFAGAYLTAESERWRLVHVTLGYTMAGLVAFRVLWGLMGTRHARFATFVRGPAAALRYLASMRHGRPEHHTGHNPAGALAIVALLVLAVAVAATGWGVYNDVAGDALEELHEGAANLMLALVVVHVVAVLLSSWLHRENLIGAMVSGRKPGTPQEGIRSAWRSVAALVLAAVLGFWWMQWRDAPARGTHVGQPTASAKMADHDDDDD